MKSCGAKGAPHASRELPWDENKEGSSGNAMSIVPKETIEVIAQSIGIANLAPDVALALAPDVEYRLREIMQVRERPSLNLEVLRFAFDSWKAHGSRTVRIEGFRRRSSACATRSGRC